VPVWCVKKLDNDFNEKWPGLSRPSTSMAAQVVDARHKAGHDESESGRHGVSPNTDR
jgi:hypothetical protein